MSVAIMTDSNSGLSVEQGKELGVYVLPMPVIIQDVCRFEGVDITTLQLFDAMKQNLNFSSSQPSPGSVMDLWDEILEAGYDEIVYLPMSSGLSGSCHAAIQYALDYDSKVQVVDNHRISVPLLDSIKDAIFLASQGLNAKEIKEKLEEVSFDSSIYITVNTLEYLKKSGRVTPAAAAIASMINLKPILTIQGEKLDSYAKVRGIHQSEKRMIEAAKHDVSTRFVNLTPKNISIGAAGTFEKEEDAQNWANKVKEAFPEYTVTYSPLSCSIASHVGPNALGISISMTLVDLQ